MNRELCGDALGDSNTGLLEPEHRPARHLDIRGTSPSRVVSNPCCYDRLRSSKPLETTSNLKGRSSSNWFTSIAISCVTLELSRPHRRSRQSLQIP